MDANTVINADLLFGSASAEPAPGDAEQSNVPEMLGEIGSPEAGETVIDAGGDGQKAEGPAQDRAREDDQAEKNRVYAAMERSIKERTRREMESKFRSDPAMAVGKRLLSEIMRTRNVDMEEAARIAERNYYEAVAERENITPDVARAIFGREQEQRPRQEEAGVSPDPNIRMQQIAQERLTAEIPEGFSHEEAVKDFAFAKLLMKYPYEAAARIYAAESRAKSAPQEVAEKLIARKQVPAPMRERPGIPQVDEYSMNDDDFLDYFQKLRGR